MSHFDERSGVVYSTTPWGQWGQTVDEVFVEVQVSDGGVRAKDIKCEIKPTSISVAVRGEEKFKGRLFGMVVKDESVWTLECINGGNFSSVFLEDKSLLRIVLVKSHRDASNCWKSLLEGEYTVNPWVLDQMEKKLTLERFQTENPGFDFSGADITGNYQGGGPTLK